jgi:hypothetical protein
MALSMLVWLLAKVSHGTKMTRLNGVLTGLAGGFETADFCRRRHGVSEASRFLIRAAFV